jgi:NAD(P)H-nitrite reductase large subunit
MGAHAHPKRNKKSDPIICKCNEVPLSVLENAMDKGCDTMNKIFDETTAGVGACGGSCRKTIVPLLEEYLRKKALKPTS